MLRILVIEDDTSLRTALVDLLAAEDYVVSEAADGGAGLALARTTRPDLILCDIKMPVLDGYGVLRALRADPATTAIPLIFLSAKAERSDLRQGMELGADDYLTKPFTRTELLNAIHTRAARQVALTQQLEHQIEELHIVIARTLPHELRTPLTGILGFATLLQEASDPLDGAEVRECGRLIVTSAERLEQLIQKHLLSAEVALLRRSPEQIELERQDVTTEAGMVIAATAHLAARAADRAADLRLMPMPGAAHICTEHLAVIVRELVENACKFSADGAAIVVSGGTDGPVFHLTVADYGRGMTAEQMAGIRAYAQFERRRYEQQGLGVGLALVLGLTESHGGTLALESTVGQGTTVHVRLLAAA